MITEGKEVVIILLSHEAEPSAKDFAYCFSVEKLMELAEGDQTAAEELLLCLEEAVWDKIERKEMKKCVHGCSSVCLPPPRALQVLLV